MVTEYQKPTFKVTEIGLLPKEWSISYLSTSCLLITDGSHYSPLEFENGTKFIATVYNMGENKIDVDSCKRISDKDYETLVRNGCKPVEGDVLFSKDGTVGICFPFNQKSDLVLLSSIAILRPKKILDPTFVSQYLKSDFGKKQVIGLKTGTALSRITLEKLKYIKIPIPSLPEQQKIAKILSDTDSLIESLDKLITKKKNIKQGLMQTLLTRGIGHTKFKKTEIGEIPEEWGTAIASDIYYIVTGTTPSTAVKEYWDQGKIEWFTPKDLRYVGASFSIFTSERKITEKAMTENSLTLLPLNSIVLSTRAPVGYVGINTKEATFNQGCKGLVPKQPEIVDTRFHAFYISHISNLLNTLSGGSTFKELSKETLGNITLPLPENGEQQEISNILSDADKEIEVLEQKRDKYKMLKTGMMQQLLTGGIRVK